MILALSRALHLRQRIDPDPPITVSYALVGMLIGTIAYAHWTALVTLPLLVVYAVYLVVTRQSLSRRVPGYILFTILIVLVVSIPYLTFSFRAPNLSGFTRYWIERPENVGEFISSILRTLASLAFRGDPRQPQSARLAAAQSAAGRALFGRAGRGAAALARPEHDARAAHARLWPGHRRLEPR